eukprot:9121366-Alexandrium_andersonii.AAC.1
MMTLSWALIQGARLAALAGKSAARKASATKGSPASAARRAPAAKASPASCKVLIQGGWLAQRSWSSRRRLPSVMVSTQ